jgi:hypothetical protein
MTPKRCKHPGCLNLARKGRLCAYHAPAYAEAARQRDNQRRADAKKDAREKAITDAIVLLTRNGYSVTAKRHEPEAFPS